MVKSAVLPGRVFRTAWFSKAAKKVHILEEELGSAIRQVMLGQAVDLGGGVFKKRLGKNLYRSIIVAKGGRYWVYEYLFAKKDQANITNAQLAGFRRLAEVYAGLAQTQVNQLIKDKAWTELCNDSQT